MTTTFQLNGKPVTVDAPPTTPVLWVLRDYLGLTGTKFGCGKGLCRACTVHVDGAAVFSCKLPLIALGGHSVTTIEGLEGHVAVVVQTAWDQNQVPQCGYCQSGQVMAAVALLSKRPKPTDADIDTTMHRNLCRCGTYQRIRKAIHEASARLDTKT